MIATNIFTRVNQIPKVIKKINCSNLHKNIPLTWKINDKILFPEVIANESKGRIYIDLVDRIHISKLRLKDSHIFR